MSLCGGSCAPLWTASWAFESDNYSAMLSSKRSTRYWILSRVSTGIPISVSVPIW